MALVLCAWTLGLQSGVPALRPSRPRPRPVLLAADAARLIEENERLIRHATRLQGVGKPRKNRRRTFWPRGSDLRTATAARGPRTSPSGSLFASSTGGACGDRMRRVSPFVCLKLYV